MLAFDAVRFDPPAPVVTVVVRNPMARENQADVLMLVDTGADITVIPRNILAQLGVILQADETFETIGFGGEVREADAVRLEITVLGRVFRGLFLTTDTDWGFVGRNVLNRFVVILNGSAQQWNEYQHS